MAPSPLAVFVADVEQLLDDPHAVGRRLRAFLGQEDCLPAEELLRTTAAVGDRPAISIHVCCTHVKRPARRILVTPTVVEVARAGRPRG